MYLVKTLNILVSILHSGTSYMSYSPELVFMPFSACSATCGGGTMTREVKCKIENGFVDIEYCHTSTTLVTFNCNTHKCTEWQKWGSWSECPEPCGGSFVTKERVCKNTSTNKIVDKEECPSKNGLGNKKWNKCNGNLCLVNGFWSPFGPWSECSVTCGTGTQTRSRTCSRPPPLNGGKDCEGNATELKPCAAPLICTGWNTWNTWSQCTVSCGGGRRSRTRTCKNKDTNQQVSNDLCIVESNFGEEDCNTHHCPIHGGYTLWGSWGSCEGNCGPGTRQRTRTCTNPSPQYGGNSCDALGPSQQTEDCLTNIPCPHVFSRIYPYAKTSWGGLGSIETCPDGTWANEFQLKVEFDGGFDDTGLNAIRLGCSDGGGSITSSVGSFGGWIGTRSCSGGYYTGAEFYSEGELTAGDDTAGNNLALQCSNGNGDVFQDGGGTDWGGWTGKVYCQDGSAICGIQTRVEGDLGTGDDTGLNQVIFECCPIIPWK